MPRRSIHRLSQQALERASADAQDRRLQLRVEFRMDEYSRTPGALLGALGGEWDLDERRFVGPGTRARVWGISELQRESVVYWMAWLRAYITGGWQDFQAALGPRPFVFWTNGGRRRGKTHFGVRALPGFTIACPEAFPSWFIAPIEDDFDEGKELHREWVKAVPPSWYEWNRREMYIQMVHGPRILMMSAHEAGKLKQGGFGYAFWNEVQKSHAGLDGLNNLLGGAADTGTIVHCASNPPRKPEEYWIEDVFEKLDRGEIRGRLLDYKGENEHVNEAALDAMVSTMSARDYAIEREGARLPRPDIVMYEFRDGPAGNVRPVPDIGDITGAFLKRKLGRAFAALAGADFQVNPHMACSVARYFDDPLDPTDALEFTEREAVIDQGDENDLIDELEHLGYVGADTLVCLSCGAKQQGTLQVVVMCSSCKERWLNGAGVKQILATALVTDATGKYQRANREHNRTMGYGDEHGSWAMFRKRGWRHLYKPDATQERNPNRDERIAASNARLCTADHVRHAFVAPRCVRTIEALKKWPNAKWGGASNASVFGHIGDAYTYRHFRLWPRRSRGDIDAAAPKIELLNVHGRGDRVW